MDEQERGGDERHRLSDELWAIMRPMLPPPKPKKKDGQRPIPGLLSMGGWTCLRSRNHRLPLAGRDRVPREARREVSRPSTDTALRLQQVLGMPADLASVYAHQIKRIELLRSDSECALGRRRNQVLGVHSRLHGSTIVRAGLCSAAATEIAGRVPASGSGIGVCGAPRPRRAAQRDPSTLFCTPRPFEHEPRLRLLDEASAPVIPPVCPAQPAGR